MGKHETGYARVERDFYPTPAWVTATLIDVIDVKAKHIWEPACGDGRISEPLKAAGARVFSPTSRTVVMRHSTGCSISCHSGNRDCASTA